MYQIQPYTYSQASKLGVRVVPSIDESKKIDVFDWTGNYICSVGARGYADYPTYIKLYGKKYADERRRLYKIRHRNDRKRVGSAGYYADKLLW